MKEICLKNCLNANLIEAGCDEAGRGPLAGPVFAAAVILPEDFHHPQLNDSKKMTAHAREELRKVIEAEAAAYSVAEACPGEIDSINILNASIACMQQAIIGLSLRPEHLLIDGNRFRPFRFIGALLEEKCGVSLYGDRIDVRTEEGRKAAGRLAGEYDRIPYSCIVKGDARFAPIAAASVLAKTYRDEYMRRLAIEYPEYGWDRNMGYPTREHIEAIRKFGLTPYHRKSFHIKELEPSLF